jgi:hypothetical protein
MSDTPQVPVPAQSHVPAKWADKFKEIADGQRKAERTAGQFFSIRAGVLSFGGNAIPNNEVDVVVLESIHERTYYAEKFGGEVSVPVCYSYSQDGEYTGPHPDAAKPQSKTCVDCPQNKWGSSDNGKGKACREGRRLSLLSAADLTDPDKVASGTVAYLRIPVTSAKGFSSHVQGVVGATDLPLFCHITRVKVLPDAKSQVKVNFSRVGGIERDDVMEAVFNRATAEAENITFPYPKPDGTAEAKPAVKTSKKF